MNTLRIGLLVSMLMVPVVSFSGDKDSAKNENSAGTGLTESSGLVSATADEIAANEKLAAEEQRENKGNLSKKTPNEDVNKNADLNKDGDDKKTLLGGMAALAWSPVKFAGGSVDWVADKFLAKRLFTELAKLGILKDNCVGKFLDDHNTGLSRALVVAVLASVAYYGWKKCKKCNEEQEDTKLKFWEEEVDTADYADGEFSI